MLRVGHIPYLVLLVLLGIVALSCNAVAEDYELIWEDEDTKSCRPGGSVEYEFMVLNNSTSTQEFIVFLRVAQYRWELIYRFIAWFSNDTNLSSTNESLSFQLEGQDTARVKLLIFPPVTARPGESRFHIRLYLAGSSEYLPHFFIVNVLEYTNVELKAVHEPNGGYRGEPGEGVTVILKLTHVGDTNDSFFVKAWTEWNSTGWSVNVESGLDDNGSTPELAPLSLLIIFLRVTVPSNAMALDSAFVNINATSKAHPEWSNEIRVLVFTSQVYSLSVQTLGPTEVTVEGGVGSNQTFSGRVINSGNGLTNVSAKPEWDRELSPGFMMHVRPPWIVLAPGASFEFEALIQVPDNVPKKIYFLWASFYPDGNEPTKVVFTIEVGQFFDVELSSSEPRRATDPGGVVDLVIQVRNVGNGLDSIRISLLGVPSGWLTYIQPQEVSLLQYEVSNVDIRIIVPTRFEEAPRGTYIFTVEAQSTRSEQTRALLDISLVINRFIRFEWIFKELPITDPEAPVAQRGILKPVPYLNPYGENIWYSPPLAIQNFGNSEVNVSLEVTTDEPRFVIWTAPFNPRLAWASSIPFYIHIEAPPGVPTGIYWVNLTLSSEDDPDYAPRLLPTRVEVYNVDVAVVEMTAQGKMVTIENGLVNVTEFTTVHLEYIVQNIGDVDAVKVNVSLYHISPDGSIEMLKSEFTTIAPGERQHLRRSWLAHDPGEHRFKVEAQLGDQARLDNDLATLNVTVNEVPEEPEGDVSWQWIGLLAVIGTLVALGLLKIFSSRSPRKTVPKEPLDVALASNASPEEKAPDSNGESPDD
jgi:uncharacterized membrane protein